jgi:ribosomal protein S18 acetylase RimI-like enzyme
VTEGPGERDSSVQAGGRGVGARLLTEAKRRAAEHGVHRVELTVVAHNQRAVKLYELYMAAILARRDPK